MIEPAGRGPASRPLPPPPGAQKGEPEPLLPAESFEKSPEKEWTVLVYLDGSNELREYVTGNLKEMESVGSTEKTDVAVYLSRDTRSLNLRNTPYHLSEMGKRREARVDPDWRGSRVFHVRKGDPGSKALSSTLLEDHGREKVRDPETLQRFLEMGMTKFPARHYLVVLSGHGNGFRGMLVDRDGRDMSLPDVRKALDGAQEATGKRIDVLALESCKMGQLEVAYELKDSAEYLVASPGNLYNEALDYGRVLGSVDKAQGEGRELTPRDMAKTIVESSHSAPDEVPTITSLELGKMPAVRDALDVLATTLSAGATPESVIERLVYDSPQYDSSRHSGASRPEREFVDIIGFCNRIVKSARVKDGALKAAAAALKGAVEEAIADRRVHEGDSSDQGLAAYIPTSRGLIHPIDPGYAELRIAADSKWDEHISGGRKDHLKALTRFLAERLGIGRGR